MKPDAYRQQLDAYTSALKRLGIDVGEASIVQVRQNDAGYGEQVEWLDFPSHRANRGLSDAEWKGLDFLQDAATQTAWRSLWPQGAGS